MYQPTLFDSFFLGGFECSTHRRHDNRRLDLLAATGHDRLVAEDYRALQRHGIRSARDGLRWHLIERQPGRYDWSSFLPMLAAARDSGTQVIWDLCHYGWPDDIDIWRPEFVERFARFAGEAARLVREHSDAVPFYSPVNEISFWAWAGGDHARFNPLGQGRGAELKHQLVRASIAAIEAIRAVEPRARFVQVDPAIHISAQVLRPAAQREAENARQAQFEAWDMLCGKAWPGLGGKPEYLDIVGVNYYSDNQWYLGGETIVRGHPDYRPFRGILKEIQRRYGRPILVAETGAEGDLRGDWLRYVSEQVGLALQQGVAVEGICLYPVLDYPGWDDDRHCPTGLFGFPDANGVRPEHAGLADELRLQQARFASVQAHHEPAVTPA
ncbi:beta-glucosidase [Pseudomonas oligotrophica]|uniref:beta-glucosidase n=1 Tax=Pseudomonas oligotrophica TaxID=2912055 RepID=UPI001F3593B2|nr:beta-glucosidase [Pseudomonas oligotrophica]MCF7200639.1 beta-glucosidase [Pseudomonas oligotrophica]